MINKKAGDTKISPLIKMSLVVLVIVIVFFGIFSFDMHKFFKNLPDFLKGNNPPGELYLDAVVYDIDVRILKNDGEGRCIVSDVPVFQGITNDWLKSYGVKEGELEIDKNPVETMDWITEDMIEIPQDFFDKEKEIMNELNSKELTLENTPSDSVIIFPPSSSLDEISDINKNPSIRIKENGKEISLLDYSREYVKEKQWNLDIICNDNNKIYVQDNGCVLISSDYFYGFSGGNLYINKGEDWYILGKDVRYEKISDIIKNQLIKKDLMKACYSEEEDFKETQILGKPVTLLLRDNDFGGDGKCIVYNSEEDLSLEHYSIKYEILGTISKRARLYRLNGDGYWENIDDELLTSGEIELRDKISELDLIEKEKQLANYLGKFSFKICLDKNGNNCPDQSQYSNYLREVNIVFDSIKQGNTKGLLSLFKTSDNLRDDDYFLLFSSYTYSITNKDIKRILWQYIQDENLNVDICTILEDCAIKKDGYSVYGGILYEWDKPAYKELDKKNYNYLYLSDEEMEKLVREKSIKDDLINKCKK